MKRKSAPKSVAQRIVFGIVFALFALYAATMLYAFLFALFSALKTHEEFVNHMFDLPRDWLFSNFGNAFTKLKVNRTDMIGMICNILFLIGGGTFFSVFC